MHQTEQDLKKELEIVRAAQQKPEVFGLLYEKYYKSIFLFVHKRVDDKELSGDLVAQVFYKALVNLPKYKYQGLPFSAWLYRIASNQLNEFFRNSKNKRAVSIDEVQVNRLIAEVEEGEDKLSLVSRLLNSLSSDELEIVELRFFEDKSHKEIAYILEISESNAKVKLFRIIEKLRKIAKSIATN